MRRPTLRRSNNGQVREPTTIPFSTEALQANLLRLQNEWETVQASRDRNAIYQYLAAVFEIVMVWAKEGKAVKRAHRALHLRGCSSVGEPEPFASIIRCTSGGLVAIGSPYILALINGLVLRRYKSRVAVALIVLFGLIGFAVGCFSY